MGRGQEDGRDERPPADRSLTTKLVLDAASLPVFWQFIGLGYKPDFMAKLDTMGNRVIDNVGLVEYADTLAMTDTEFFDAVIGEFFTQWPLEARRLGITRRGVLRCIEQQRILLSIRDSRSTFCSVAQAVRLTCGQTPGLWTNPRPDAADVLRFRS